MTASGKDFDDQWRRSRREGREKARRGDTYWANDKFLERENRRLSGPPAHHAGQSSCMVMLLMLASAVIAVALMVV